MRLTRITNHLSAHGFTACRIRVLDGPDAGLELNVPPVGVVVGADPSADVTLNDPAVSRRHCAVVPVEEGFEVTDLGSKNGTFLDGTRLSRAVVPVGAVLRLGTSLLNLIPEEELLEIPMSQRESFGRLVGKSIAMRKVFSLLERASISEATILLIGESGTGKELASRAVHEASPRRDGPFVVFDCGAASETLIESALFGHMRGAFTGADRDRKGAFAAAHNGTLFLDEIGDLPLAMQPKLLRLLETGEVTPLGTSRSDRYDVRVVAATHRDLWEEVCRGAFRGDLFYRLSVVEVRLPALRQHKEDIRHLIGIFLAQAGAAGVEPEGPTLKRLMDYNWPGNVRELRNVITRAVALMSPGADFSGMPILIRSKERVPDGDPGFNTDLPFHEAKAELLGRFERAYLTDLLARAKGNLSQASRLAGLERKYLYRLLEKAGLRPDRSSKPDVAAEPDPAGTEPEEE